MGLFDFLRTKKTEEPAAVSAEPISRECDVAKTQVIVDLFKVPAERRDNAWQQSFYSNVRSASFRCGDPQTFHGPDGLPYFILNTPEPGKPFESFCIMNLIDYLLANGLGVSINPREGAVDWVFSYGDIVNLSQRNEFYSAGPNVQLPSRETLGSEQKIMVAQPSLEYLPQLSRDMLRSFLQSIGIAEPKVMLISRKTQGHMIQQLAFNIFIDDLPSPEDLDYRLQQISWFLPRHYIVLSLPRDSDLVSSFQAL